MPTQRLHNDGMVVGTTEYPILWLRDGEDCVCSANGRAFTVTASPQIVLLLERRNSGQSHRVQTLIDEHTGSAAIDGIEFETSAAVRMVLEKLVATRVIVVGD